MIGITNWMADFMGALIFTTLTGSVALMIWDAFGCRLEEYGYFRWYYAGWKLVILLFLVPVVYVAGVCFPRFRYWFGISVPAVAAGSWRVLAVCGIWGLGVLVMCFYFGRQALWLHGRNRGNFSCEEWKRQVFENTCMELGIPAGRVRLWQNYQVDTAECMGLFRCRVILPVGEYTREELRTIFLHELTHYQQGDILLRYGVVLVVATQYFNPMVWYLNGLIRQWSEYACDQRACVLERSPVLYFRHILRLAERVDCQKTQFAAYLARERKELLKRVEHMKKIEKTRPRPAGFVVLFVCVLLLVTAVLVLSESNRMSRIYNNFAEDFKEPYVQEEDVSGRFLELFSDGGMPEGYQVEYGKMRDIEWSVENIRWELEGKTVMLTEPFWAEDGQTLFLSFGQSDQDTELVNGVIAPSGARFYTMESAGLGWEIPVSELEGAGEYRFFIQNDHESPIDVNGVCEVCSQPGAQP